MKTAKEWFETLPSPVKEKALANLEAVGRLNSNHKYESLHDTILCAFDWYSTPEGSKYWESIASASKNPNKEEPSLPWQRFSADCMPADGQEYIRAVYDDVLEKWNYSIPCKFKIEDEHIYLMGTERKHKYAISDIKNYKHLSASFWIPLTPPQC
jgi:hypothetical protein